MTVHYRTKGFVLKKTDRQESNRIFSIFTYDFGKLEITGKAVRKINSKLRAGIDIFYLSDIEFIQGKNNKTLTDASVIKKNDNIIKDFKKLEVVCQIANILEELIKGKEKDHKIWDLVEEIFEKLNSQDLKISNKQLIYYYFFWNFLSALGYRPEVEKCAACNDKLNPYNIYFSDREGGMICKKCLLADKNAKKINSDVAKILRLILKKDWQTVSKLKVELLSQDLLKKISEDYSRHILPVHYSNTNSI